MQNRRKAYAEIEGSHRHTLEKTLSGDVVWIDDAIGPRQRPRHGAVGKWKGAYKVVGDQAKQIDPWTRIRGCPIPINRHINGHIDGHIDGHINRYVGSAQSIIRKRLSTCIEVLLFYGRMST